MALKVTKVQVWAGALRDIPGGLAGVLRGVADAGGSLDFIIARRERAKPGTGVVFVTPVKGSKVQQAARASGLKPADNIGTLRVEGPDQPGLGARLSAAIADARINLRGFSAAAIGSKFVAYIGFDSPADADKGAKAIKGLRVR